MHTKRTRAGLSFLIIFEALEAGGSNRRTRRQCIERNFTSYSIKQLAKHCMHALLCVCMLDAMVAAAINLSSELLTCKLPWTLPLHRPPAGHAIPPSLPSLTPSSSWPAPPSSSPSPARFQIQATRAIHSIFLLLLLLSPPPRCSWTDYCACRLVW